MVGGAAAWAGAFRPRTQHFLSSRPLHRKESVSLRMELNVLADCPLLTLPGPPMQRNQLGHRPCLPSSGRVAQTHGDSPGREGLAGEGDTGAQQQIVLARPVSACLALRLRPDLILWPFAEICVPFQEWSCVTTKLWIGVLLVRFSLSSNHKVPSVWSLAISLTLAGEPSQQALEQNPGALEPGSLASAPS